MRNGTYAVIPVKPFASAKGRLAPILNGFERAQLARVMLTDVLEAVRAARGLDGFFVVTCNQDAARLAEAYGGKHIAETGEFGLAHAVGTAISRLRQMAAGGLVVVPADIPHLPTSTIEAVLAKTPDQGITLVPATYDGGTNLMAMRPVHLLPPQFGPRSFFRHRWTAIRAGLSPVTHICPLAGHDLDRPNDLQRFLSLGSTSRTQDFLAGLDIAGRLAAARGQPAASYIPASA